MFAILSKMAGTLATGLSQWQLLGRRGRQTLVTARWRTSPCHPAPQFRPTLEALEDRCVPSTIVVTRSTDDVSQRGTLRYALAHAAQGDAIRLSPALRGVPIVLTQGELVLDKDLTIESLPHKPQTIGGGGTSRVFEVAAGAHVTLTNLTITGGEGIAHRPAGSDPNDGIGGGVLNLGMLTVNGCTLFGSFADLGGGVANEAGRLIVNGSTLSGNFASFGGGGIDNDAGTLTVRGSTLSGNSAVFIGGGIANVAGAATISGSTLTGNVASVDVGGGIYNTATLLVSRCILSGNAGFAGGGIYNNGGTVTVGGSTLSGNTGVDGGGILSLRGSLSVSDCTLSGNSATFFGGGIYVELGTATVRGCVFSGNTAGGAPFGGGAICNFGAVTVSDSVFSDNNPDAIFGGYTDGGGNIFR
jgi:predicted outer membrane repeat protein